MYESANSVPEQMNRWVAIGLIAGLLAGPLFHRQGLGLVSSVVLGSLGAMAGRFLFTVLHIQLPLAFISGIAVD